MSMGYIIELRCSCGALFKAEGPWWSDLQTAAKDWQERHAGCLDRDTEEAAS